ncbi:MAG: flagellar filament outer layer protein FlaA [Treponema sp.]|nr:flagellar filament outer layer protein FlaA [Treponema sp.]
MKQGSFRAVRLRIAVILLIVMCLAVGSVFANPRTVDYLSVIIEPFAGYTVREWAIAGRTYRYDFEWALDASRFIARDNDNPFPRRAYVEAYPRQLFGNNPNNLDLRSLGIHGSFDRRGHNWIDVYPIETGSGQDGETPIPFEIPMPGRVHSLDMWVWGANLNLRLEAYFRDHTGVVHAVEMGSLYHEGWRNLNVNIPDRIPQSRRVLPRYAGLHFVKFRIWTEPNERVDNFYVYFNQMKVLTNTFESLYDGNDLADPDNVRALWVRN